MFAHKHEATVIWTINVSQRDSKVLEWLVGRFNGEHLSKHYFSLWTLEQSKFELNFSHPNWPTYTGDFLETSALC